MAAGNSLSFLHVVKPEIDLPEGTDVYADEVYAKGAENLSRLKNDGILIQEQHPALYLYRQRMGDHVQTGVVAGASVDEYEADLIKKHEHTRPLKEDDRTRHIDALDANTGPVFLTYPALAEIDRLVAAHTNQAPTYDFVAEDGIGHTLWVVADSDQVSQFVAAFAQIPALYVADGHHRSAAGTRIRTMRRDANPQHTGREAYNYFLAVMFPHNQMKILGYNRVVRDLAGLDESSFMRRIEESFDISATSAPQPSSPRTWGMYLAGSWYALSAKPGTFPADDPVKSLDAAILQDNLLDAVLGISDPRSDDRLDFVGGIRGAEELVKLVDAGTFRVAFTMYPTSIEQLLSVADAGQVMPPKSTWFEPKLRSGLIVRPLGD